MTPQEKRLKTIKERYGSVSNMLKNRDVRDLILGGYNGGIKRGTKGFATWDERELKHFTKKKERDRKGRFTARDKANSQVRDEDTSEQTNR